jgi:hypothetical protein
MKRGTQQKHFSSIEPTGCPAEVTLIVWKQQHLHPPMGQEQGRSTERSSALVPFSTTLILKGWQGEQQQRMQKPDSSRAVANSSCSPSLKNLYCHVANEVVRRKVEDDGVI